MITTEGTNGQDWLGDLLAGFDPGWVIVDDGLGVDDARRGGLRRISGVDPGLVLRRLLELYAEEKARMLGYARQRLGVRAQDAEDVIQEILRKACQNPPKLRDPAALRSYAYAAIYNETCTWGERAAAETNRRSPDEDALTSLVDPSPEFDEKVVRNLVIARALATLAPRERQMIELVDIGRLTEKEAAAKMGIALGTAKNYRHVARRRLQADPALVELRMAA